MAFKYCPSCGRENTDDNNFCPNCGAKLGGEADSSASPQKLSIEELKDFLIDGEKISVLCRAGYLTITGAYGY